METHSIQTSDNCLDKAVILHSLLGLLQMKKEIYYILRKGRDVGCLLLAGTGHAQS